MFESAPQRKRRIEILKSAKDVFSSAGFHKAGMDEIARRANIAKGTVYLYFPSKIELFIAVIKDGLENLAQKISSEVEVIESSADKIKKAISTYMLFFSDNQQLYRILLHPDLDFNDEVRKIMKDVKLSKLPQITITIKKGIEKGEIRELDEESLSYMILGMTDFLLFQWLSNPNTEPIEKKIDQINDVLFRGISAD
jgi:TetR/AcrR family fatty acid metabolism transcriptional regulator